jgi:hypothetical protein
MSATTTTRLTSRQRLGKLAEQRLKALEAEAAKGKPPTASELNGLRRLIDGDDDARQREQTDAELARLRELTT